METAPSGGLRAIHIIFSPDESTSVSRRIPARLSLPSSGNAASAGVPVRAARKSSKHDASGARGKKAEMPNGMLIVIRNVLRKELDEHARSVAGYYLFLQFVILGAEADLTLGVVEYPTLSQWRPADVPACVTDKVLFGSASLNVQAPPALVLRRGHFA